MKKGQKFKLKQFKQMKPKKKKEKTAFSRYSDTSKGFAFGKSKGTSFGVGYNHNELDGTEIKEGKFTPKMIAKLKKDYESLRGKRLSLGKNVELEKIVKGLAKDEDALVQLVKADIPFITMNARLILNKDYGVPLNKYEGVNEASSDTTDMYALMV